MRAKTLLFSLSFLIFACTCQADVYGKTHLSTDSNIKPSHERVSETEEVIYEADPESEEAYETEELQFECETTSYSAYRERLLTYFPGLEINDNLTKAEISEKEILSEHVSEIVGTKVSAGKSITSYGDPENGYVKGEIIIEAATKEEADRTAKAYGGKVKTISYGVAVISLPEDVTVAQALVAAADKETRLPAVWPNDIYSAAGEETIEEDVRLTNAKKIHKRQWMHKVLGTREAWKAGYKGQNVKVAVIDTGIRENHPDISANCLPGRKFTDEHMGDDFKKDMVGHGTHIAGIVCADDNKFLGTGVAPDAMVGSFCIFNDEKEGTLADVVRAINAVVEDGSYNIINLSLGGYNYNEILAKAVKRAYDDGIIVFAAAGNEASTSAHYPSDYEGAFSIASLNKKGAPSDYSNHGSNIDFSFPGEEIYSIDYKRKNAYAYESGTSMATAVASGVAAVIISSDERFINEKSADTVDEIISIMIKGSRKTDTEEWGAISTYLPKALSLVQ